MEDKSIALLVAAFVALIIGVSLLVPTADIILGVTATTGITGESIDISSARNGSGSINASVNSFTIEQAPTGWKIADCPITGVTYRNSSTDYTLTTDYTFTDTTGVLRVVVGGEADINGVNSTLIDYNYCTDDYISEGWARTVLDLVPGFFALALLLISVALFYQIGKDEGIIS